MRRGYILHASQARLPISVSFNSVFGGTDAVRPALDLDLAGHFQGFAVKAHDGQCGIDHALRQQRLPVTAPGYTLRPFSDFDFAHFGEICSVHPKNDKQSRIYLDPKDFLNMPMESRWIYDHSVRSIFTAKVALGGGYFLFRDAYRTATDYDELRKLIRAEDVTHLSTTLIADDPVLKGHWP